MHQVLLIIICCCWAVAFGYAAASEKTITAESLVSDLQSNRRSVFAIGNYLLQLNLFVSGLNGSLTAGGGDVYRVEVGCEPPKGVFQVADSAIHPVDTGHLPPGFDAFFICLDHLMLLNGSTVANLTIGGGEEGGVYSVINSNRSAPCYQGKEALYVSADAEGNFLTVEPKNGGHLFSLELDLDVAGCYGRIFGCLNMDNSSASRSMPCSPVGFPSYFISGYVGAKNAYLFDSSNAVHLVSATVFGTSSKNGDHFPVTKVASKEAFKVVDKPSTTKPPPPPTAQSTVNSSSTAENGCNCITAIIVTAVVVALLFTIGIVVYCVCFSSDGNNRGGGGGKGVAGNGKKVVGKKKGKVSKASSLNKPSSAFGKSSAKISAAASAALRRSSLAANRASSGR